MSDDSSRNQPGITVMRWIARIVSIPWAYVALGLAWFAAGYGMEEGKLSPWAVNIIVCITFLLTLGATILAAVWRMEGVGGWVLLADCVLAFVCFAASPHSPWDLFPFVFVPPLLGGSLFLACYYRSKSGGVTGLELKKSEAGGRMAGN